jgi:hypothetical protein
MNADTVALQRERTLGGKYMAKKWITGAIKRKGAFTAKAKRTGKSVGAFAQKEKGASGLTGQQARLAITLRRMNARRGR